MYMTGAQVYLHASPSTHPLTTNPTRREGLIMLCLLLQKQKQSHTNMMALFGISDCSIRVYVTNSTMSGVYSDLMSCQLHAIGKAINPFHRSGHIFTFYSNK